MISMNMYSKVLNKGLLLLLINFEVFENWCAQILGRLAEGSVIVMDNASYHGRKTENIPNSGTKKADIQAWLTSTSIIFESDMTLYL